MLDVIMYILFVKNTFGFFGFNKMFHKIFVTGIDFNNFNYKKNEFTVCLLCTLFLVQTEPSDYVLA